MTGERVPFELVWDVEGISVAWVSRSGLAVARYRSIENLAPVQSGHVGPKLGLVTSPSGVHVDGELYLAFVADGQVHVARLGGPVEPLGVKGREVALAASGGELHAVVVDAEGLVHRALHLETCIPKGRPTRLVKRRDVLPGIGVFVANTGVHAVYVLEDALCGVVRCPRHEGEAPRDVRNPLDRPATEIHVAQVVKRAALVLGEGGERIRIVRFSSDAMPEERAAVAIYEPGSKLVAPRAIWYGDRFLVAARDEALGSLRIDEVGEDARTRFVVPDVDGPFELVYRDQRMVLLGLELVGDTARVQAAFRSGSGESFGTKHLDATPADAAARSVEVSLARLVRDVAGRASTTAYREARAPLVAEAERLFAHGELDEGTVYFRATRLEDGIGLVFEATGERDAPVDEEGLRTAAPLRAAGAIDAFVRWVKEALPTDDGRQAEADDAAMAESLAGLGEASFTALDREEATLRGRVVLGATPEPSAVLAVLRAAVKAARAPSASVPPG